MRLYVLVMAVTCHVLASAQTTTTYTTSTTWAVPAGVSSIAVTVWGGAGGTGGQDCGAGCSNPAAGNVGYVMASFAVTAGNVVGIYPGGQAVNGANSVTNSGGGTGGVASYSAAYKGGDGGNAGSSGSSGGGGGGGAASVMTITSVIKVVAGGAGGGGGMANLAGSGQNGTNTYSANGTLNVGGVGTQPGGDGGGGGGGGGGNYGSLGGTTHAAGSEQAGNGGNIGGNLVSGATTTTSNTNIAWTSGGRIDITYTVTLPVTWLSFTAAGAGNGSVLLNWSTAGELNTRAFLVQRNSGNNEWATVAQVTAAGNSTATIQYQYTDKTIVKNTYYYRLAQIDLDGKMTYSKTVSCFTGGPLIKLYPNPVTDRSITVSMTAGSVVIIYNSQGAILLNKKLPAGDSKLDLGNYAPGVYFLKAGEQKISFIVK
ncbi:MAG: T9SS type A sorting domain-containing protein [Bacteroidota bacterium]